MEITWIEWAYYVTLLCELLLLGCLVWSISNPDHRIWPPPGSRSWQFWLAWVLALRAWIGYDCVFFSYFDTSQATLSLRLWIGVPLLVLGAGLALLGVYSLGTIITLGIKDRLIDTGAYRYSRNPKIHRGCFANHGHNDTLWKYALCEEECVCAPEDVHFYCKSCKETYCLPTSKVPAAPMPERFRKVEANHLVQ